MSADEANGFVHAGCFVFFFKVDMVTYVKKRIFLTMYVIIIKKDR